MASETVEATLKTMTKLPEMGMFDYSWDEFGAWYDPEQRIFYWYEDSGCSCTAFMDYVEEMGELQVGRKEDLLRAARDYSKMLSTDGHYAQYVDGVDAFFKALDEIKA